MAIDTPSWATEPTAQATPAWASTPQPQAAEVPSWAAPTPATPSQPSPVAKGTPESNVRTFLNFLSKAEGASYNTIVGGGSFSDFSKHPNVVGLRTADGPSTAAGAYQITGTTYRGVAGKLGIKDFSETSQDQIAIELIRQKGALQDVANGNWEAAINKLGGVWASLPSSQYGQAKRSMEWSIATLNGKTPPPGYQPFAPVRKDVDPKSLNSDQDWVRASLLMYELFERKPFQGTPSDAAEYGKDGLGSFNFNLVSMAEIAHAVSQGTQEQKQAFLYMLDTYDNTQFSWEGTGRGFKSALTDPTNLIGVGTLGVATVGKFIGRKALVETAKQTVEKSLLQGLKDQAATSLGRTGVVAGIDAGVVGAASSTIKQGVEVSAGRRDEISLGQVAMDTGVAAVAGAVVGTAADAAVAKISRIIRGETVDVAKGAAKAPEAASEATPSVSGVARTAEGKSPAEDTFSGTISGVHGSERPLDNVASPNTVPEAYRYDSTGGVWGDGFYSSEKGDYSWFRGGEIRMTDYSYATEVSNTFNKAAVLTPETTVGVFERLGIKGIEYDQDLVAALKSKGYDGVIVRDFNGDSAVKIVEELQAKGILGPDLHGNSFEAALMNQVVHFAPDSGVKVKGADSTLGPLMDRRREIAEQIDEKVKAAGFSYLNDARYVINQVEKYAGESDVVSKANYEYAKKQYGDRYEEAKKFLDSISDLLKKKDEVDTKISKAANLPKQQAPTEGSLGSTLTPAEIAAATERKQKGRLEADNTAPNLTGQADVPVNVPAMNTGLRSTPMSMEQLSTQGGKVADQLRDLGNQDLTKALEQLRTANAPFEETRIIARGVQMYADELRIAKAELVKEINANPNGARVSELSAKIEALDARMAPLEMADDAFGSMAGSLLRQRQEGLPGVQGITVESIMKEQSLSKADAEKVWAEMVSKAEKTEAGKKIAAEYDAKADALIAAGDLEGAARAAIQKNRELASLADEAVPGGASFIQKLTEFAISNVFSFKTVLVNLIPSGLKTLVIPGLKVIMSNPLDKVARIEAMASYSAMRSSFGAALQAAKAGFRYEQALLTRDGTRLVEGELAMTGKLGGGLRIFPRILNASDEFLSRINYDSFVAGRAAAEAAMKATEEGLTGKALDQAVDKAVKATLATSREVSKGDELINPIINKGRNLGLTGEDLFKWVEREAMRDPESLRKGTDEEALNFVRDVLYKRSFSGEGSASKAAVQYEETLKKFPSLKLVVGQLFFRTPIRVFEEGIRLTPGIQLLAPGFIQDLAGNNGTLRQVRAQAEAMSSLAVAGGVLSLYSMGRITGDGAYSDWKQQRTRTDGPLPEPYTIKMSDGSTWSYRSFDPLATPIKIMVNGLERMDRLHLRESQGEFIAKSEFDKAMAYITVATTSVAAAIRDANLVAGIDGTIKFFENLADPERKEDAMLKMVGEKLFLLVPNTLHKIAKDNDPSIKDPVTFWQVVEEKLLRPFGQDDVKTPYSYDVLGNVRKMADTGSLWNVFSTSSMEERGKGMSEEGKFVMSELDRLSRVTGATFKPPTKHKELGDFDMRTIVAADGKSTLYDVWQKNYKEMQPDVVLHPIMKAEMPDGTFKTKALRVELVQQTISDMQDAAFYKMLNSEQVVVDKLIENTLNQERAKAGLFDSKRPY